MSSHTTLPGATSWKPRAIFFLYVGLVIFVFLGQTLSSEFPDHGDYGSDQNIINAAKNLDRDGFLPLRFGMTLDSRQQAGLDPWYYTHWPAFPSVILATQFRIGLDLPFARLLPLLISCSAIIALFYLVLGVLRNERAALWVAATLATCAPFRLLSDGLTYMPYDLALKAWIFLLISKISIRAGNPDVIKWALYCTLLVFLMVGLSGYEMVPSVILFSFLFPLFFSQLAYRMSSLLTSVVSVGVGLFLGVTVVLLHWAWLSGSVTAVISEIERTLIYRTTAGVKGSGTQILYFGRSFTYEMVYRLVAYYPIYMCLVPFAMIAFFCKHHLKGSMKLLCVVFASELGWFLLFPKHAHLHVHTVAHFSFTVALTIGLLLAIVNYRLKSFNRGFAWVGGGVVLVIWGLTIASVGVRPYFNLQIETDWAQRASVELSEIMEYLPEEAIVIAETSIFEQRPQGFLGRPVVKISSTNPGSSDHPSTASKQAEQAALSRLAGRSTYLLVSKNDASLKSERYTSCSRDDNVVIQTANWILCSLPR